MKLKFEEWILTQNISFQAQELIREAITCYKASAYKASLLFSYLCFQTILKDRILNAKRPDLIPERMWEDLQGKLLDDDRWENTLIGAVKQMKPAQIFVLSEDVRRQYEYWKDRRNDCAHAKGNAISYPHVETFWMFFQSNLAKFTVNGGKDSLIEKIMVHFDRSLTPKYADFKEILNEIPHAISTKDYKDFLDKIHIFSTPYLSYDDEEIINFWTELFTLNGEFTDILIKFLISKKKLCLMILRNDPRKVVYFSSDKQFIRSIWKDRFYSYKDFYIFISLLRHRLIPEEQLEEAIEQVTTKIGSSIFGQAEDVDIIALEDVGFFEIFKKLAFGSKRLISNFEWARENKHLIVLYLKKYGLNNDIVHAINDTFNAAATPWKLGDALVEFFYDNPQFKENYIRITEELEEELPSKLGF